MDVLAAIQNLIEQLSEERAKLLEYEMSPPGVWVHEYTVLKECDGVRLSYRYAKWQAEEPIFDRRPKKRERERLEKEGLPFGKTNHRHIGRVGSSTGLPMEYSVIEAKKQYARRQRLEEIDAALAEILSCLNRISKSNSGIYND